MTTQVHPLTIDDIPAQTREAIYDHVFSSPEIEVGGVLVGAVDADGRARVHGMIAALEAEGARASVTFTHDAWERILAIQERDFPDSPVIVGWYHSHPGFGIFLSEHDTFIHRNFFREPYQVAYVVDPSDGSEGLFGWRGAKIEEIDKGRASSRATPRRRAVVVDLDDLVDPPDSEPTPAPLSQAEQRAQLRKLQRARHRRSLLTAGAVALGLAVIGVGASIAVDGGSDGRPLPPGHSGETGDASEIVAEQQRLEQQARDMQRRLLGEHSAAVSSANPWTDAGQQDEEAEYRASLRKPQITPPPSGGPTVRPPGGPSVEPPRGPVVPPNPPKNPPTCATPPNC
jgi:proteasome lid subunit RPN8/RPN11